MIEVTVCYARERLQERRLVKVSEGASIAEVLEKSHILEDYPEIDLTQMKTGIYSEIKSLETPVTHGDRIELYRPVPNQRRTLRK